MNKVNFRTDILPLKDRLFRIALRITMNRQEAEDVVQETLIKVWNQREHWDEIDNIEAYTLKACHNKALDSIKRASHNTVPLENAEVRGQVVDSGVRHIDPYHQMFQREQLQQVSEIINSLPDKLRTCVQLRDIEGKSYQEISEILNITSDQVKVDIYRARRFIREKIGSKM